MAAREALALKPLVVRRVPTCAVLPVRDVELPLGYLRQDSLQFFEPLNVHGHLPGSPRRVRDGKAYAPSLKAQASAFTAERIDDASIGFDEGMPPMRSPFDSSLPFVSTPR